MIFSPFGVGRPLFGIPFLDHSISIIPTLPLEWFGFPSWFHPSFGNPHLWSLDIIDFYPSFKWSVFHLLLAILPDSIFVSWDWLLLAETGSMHQSAQRKRGGFMMCREAMWSLFVFSLDFGILFTIPCFIWISGTKFLIRWVECKIPS